MTQIRITIEGEFVTQNEYIKAERSNKGWAAAIKDNESTRVYYETLNKHKPVDEYPIDITFVWYRKDRRTDPDNVALRRSPLRRDIGRKSGVDLHGRTGDYPVPPD